MSDKRPFLTAENFYRAFINGWIVDGRSGGLIVGRTHETGHIVMIEPAGELAEFDICGLVSHGEYILSTEATEKNMGRLQEINADPGPSDKEITLTINSRLLNTSAEPHDKLLIIHRQMIINAASTKRHFEELEHLNSLYSTGNGILFNENEINYLNNTNV